ncbi:sulfide-quinone oxidoreductase [Hyaloraphidium curvatum]|nr:sulfide-quinone oxidoreductase [Hyaloraphidium curvatum]
MSAFRPLLSRPRVVLLAFAAGGAAAAVGVARASPFSNAVHAETPGKRQKVVIVGGGSAGVGVASQLHNALKSDAYVKGGVDIVVVEPSDVHYYQPGWTLVGSGIAPLSTTWKPMAEVMPAHATWIKKAVAKFDPERNKLSLDDGSDVSYDFLVVAAGLQTDFGRVKGLKEALEDPSSPVATIYDFRFADKAYELVKGFQRGTAIFTSPAGVIKCGGAPIKMMFLSEDYWRKHGVRHQMKVEYCPAGPAMFAVQKYSDALNILREERKVNASFGHELVEVDAAAREAKFKNPAGEIVTKHFDFLHVAPPFHAPDFVRESPLADPASGFVEVNKETLQHTRYGNVFSIGDSSNLPTSKTIAAITAQAPVLTHNLATMIRARALGLPQPPLTAKYDGYTSCPLLTAHGELMLAEFTYGGVPKETFGHLLDQSMPRYMFYKLKTDFFPWVYWKFWPQGRWYGSKGFFKPTFEDPIPKMVSQQKVQIAEA